MKKEIIGGNLKALREKAGFSQGSIARYLGVDQSLISKYESGERSMGSEVVEKLAALFGVTVTQIESENAAIPQMNYAFRGNHMTEEDMETIAAINRIALNGVQLQKILSEVTV